MPLTMSESKSIATVGVVMGSLSLICIFFVLASYALFPALRNFKARLIVYLNISMFLWIGATMIGLGYFMNSNGGVYIPKSACDFSGFFLQWFIVSTDLWFVMIALYLFLRVHNLYYMEDKEWVIHLVCWGIPFIIALLPFWGVGKGYGIAGSWCWVKDPLARLFFSYLPVWLCALVICCLYASIYLTVRKTTKSNESHKSVDAETAKQMKKKVDSFNSKVFKKLAAFPILFIILWIVPTVNRIQNQVAPDKPIASLFKVHLVCVFGEGFWVFFIFGAYNIRYIYNRTLSKSEPSAANSNSIQMSTTNTHNSNSAI